MRWTKFLNILIIGFLVVSRPENVCMKVGLVKDTWVIKKNSKLYFYTDSQCTKRKGK